MTSGPASHPKDESSSQTLTECPVTDSVTNVSPDFNAQTTDHPLLPQSMTSQPLTNESPSSSTVVPFTITAHDVMTIILAISFPIVETTLHSYRPGRRIHPLIVHFAFAFAFAWQYVLSLMKPVRPRVLRWYLHDDLYHSSSTPSQPTTNISNRSDVLSDDSARTSLSLVPEASEASRISKETHTSVTPKEKPLDGSTGFVVERVWPLLHQAALFLSNIFTDLARHAITTFTTLAVQTLKGIITEQVKNLVASLVSHFIVASLAVWFTNTMMAPRPGSTYVPPPDGEYKIQI